MRFLLSLSLLTGALLTGDDLQRPYANAQDKAAETSPLSLVELHEAGISRYQSRASHAASHLGAQPELRKELNTQGKEAGTAISGIDLCRLAAYESGADRAAAPDGDGRVGLFALDTANCQDVRVPFDEIDEAEEWRRHAEAGRLIYVRLAKALRHHLEQDHELSTDEVELTPFHLYLAHRTSASDAATLLAQVISGTARTQPASSTLLGYLQSDPDLATALQAEHDLRAIEAYSYLLGGWHAMEEALPEPPPEPPADKQDESR